MKQLTRYPLEPLTALVGTEGVELARDMGLGGTDHSAKKAVRNAHRKGLTRGMADRWAIAAGFHPTNIWPEWGTDV